MESPTPEEVRGALSLLDDRRKKIVAALFGLMVRNPGQVRDREWISRHLAQVVVLAGGFAADTPDAGVQEVERFLQENAAELLRAAYLLFQRVGLDMAPRAEEGFSFDEALRAGLAYL